MFTLAHLSDPHLPPLPTPRLVELAGKRAFGFLNWHRGRKHVHRREVVDDLVRDLSQQDIDHVAVTGDLINISLRAEYPPARAWLETLGSPHDVTLVPGNHDIYVRAARGWPAEFWGDYMRSDDGASSVSFPFLRRRGPAALIALSTALPTAPFLATGRLGEDQIARLAHTLDQCRGLFRIVLIHHSPFATPRQYLKRLTDAGPLLRVLADEGAELLVHGHYHTRSFAFLEGPNGRTIPAAGVPSASALAHGGDDPAGYNLFRIDGAPGAWRCEVIARQRAADGSMSDSERRTLS